MFRQAFERDDSGMISKDLQELSFDMESVVFARNMRILQDRRIINGTDVAAAAIADDFGNTWRMAGMLFDNMIMRDVFAIAFIGSRALAVLHPSISE